MKTLTISDLAKYDVVRDNLIVRLVNKKNVKPNRVSLPLIGDIVATIGIHMSTDELGESATAVITEDSLKKYGKTVMEVYTDAIANLKSRFSLKSMHRVLLDMGVPAFIIQDTPKGMYILTTDTTTNGAACIFNPEIMDIVREEVGDNLVIIPSSVHEVIIVDIDEFPNMTVKDITSMIHEVNGTELEDEDLLSEYAYRYDYAHHCVVRA